MQATIALKRQRCDQNGFGHYNPDLPEHFLKQMYTQMLDDLSATHTSLVENYFRNSSQVELEVLLNGENGM